MRKILLFATLFSSLALFAQQRPQIIGIAYVRFHVSDMSAARRFYQDTLGLACADAKGFVICRVGDWQSIRLDANGGSEHSNEEEIAFYVQGTQSMRSFLAAHGYSHFEKSASGGLSILGPEGHRITFLSRGPIPVPLAIDHAASHRIIHVGFTVQDRDAEEKFFRDLLGFRLYWTGGPDWDGTEEHRAYMSYQVPDGRDWVEFMLHRPADATAKQNGGSNHVALGVEDIQKARERLVTNGWTGDAQPKQGQDGKWQLNLFDPDGTRTEFMEFTPSREPCCTKYQQPHPSPADR